MEISTSNLVQSLNTAAASRVQVGNNYNTTNNYHRVTDENDTTRLLEAIQSTDPRNDKINIEQTNDHLLRESYKWILENPEFLAWRDESHESRLLWIKGDPGKGKTMLLCGIIDELIPSTRLANPENHISLSYFFCQATNSNLNSSTAVLRGLIFLLVVQQPCLLSHLRTNTHWDTRVAIESLFHRIIADPALEQTYLIVDALDECLEDLEFLLEIISSSIPHIKWIVSSRYRREIEEGLEQSSSKLGLSLELNEKSVSQAIGYFIDHRTKELVKRKRLKDEVAQEIQRHLVQHANGTFLWVGLVCRRLRRCQAWEISEQLLQLPKGLNELYSRMMNQIRKSDSSKQYIRLLAIISTVFRPLTFSELMAIEQLDLDKETLLDYIGECGSFLTTRNETVLFVHQSAKEFLVNTSSELLFRFGLAHHHYGIFQRSIDILQCLHKDMYGLVYPGISLDDAIRNRPDPDPLGSLEYALVFWADHLREAYRLSLKDGHQAQSTFVKPVHRFLSHKLLFWLEALSLCHSPLVAGKALLFLKGLPAQILSESGLTELVEDALRFLLLFGPVIGNYPLQIYASGLLFIPQKSLIRDLFQQYTPEFIERTPQVDETWSPILGVFETSVKNPICTMMFSPSNETLVMTSNSELLLWNISDGSVHKIVKYNDATMLTPSPDLQWLALVIMRYSDDAEKLVQHTLQARELNSEKPLWTRNLDGQNILAMEISPDGRSLAVFYETELQLYTREGDMYRSWALVPGTNLRSLSLKFSDISPWQVLFSSDCSLLLLVHRGDDWVMLAFDAQTGKHYKLPDSLATDMNDQSLSDARFVPSTHTIIIIGLGESDTFFWDPLKEECKSWFLFDDYADCLAYSHDDFWLAMTSGHELLLLDRDHRTILQHVNLGLAFYPEAIEVSFDNQKIAVRSSTTAWLLDVGTILTNRPSSDRQEKRNPRIFNDGITIAYHDSSSTIELDNPITGVITTLDIRKHVDRLVTCTAMSPDGQIFAYANVSSIHIWDLQRESLQYNIGGFADVSHLAISSSGNSDGHWVAVCTPFKVHVWDINAGKHQRVIKSPKQAWSSAKACFAGTLLGVVWYSHIMERCDKGLDAIFVLYDIKAGQIVSEFDLPWFDASHRKFESFSMSPNGKWMVAPILDIRSLLLCDVEAGIQCALIDINKTAFSFIDNSGLWTRIGVISIKNILDNLTVKSKTERRRLAGLDEQVVQEIPVIIPSFDKYSTSGEWITFDKRPLIWLPQQYRQSREGFATKTAIGHHHITMESLRGIYCVLFRHDAGEYLRKAVHHLSI